MTAQTRPTDIRKARWPKNLDQLAALSVDELTALYREVIPAESMRVLSGDPVCRMLAVRGLDSGVAASALRRFAAARRFPWIGKRFSATGDREGHGINRVRLAGEHTWFPFETRYEPSAIDDRPCVFLDYRLPENPAPIRLIRDELRELEPGLMFGPAMLDNGKSPATLVLYFACDFRR
jgi:hypothetical protein